MSLHLNLSTLTLAATCLLCSYCTSISTTPPNPEPSTLQPNDTIGHFLLNRQLIVRFQHLLSSSLWLYHISLILFFPQPGASTALCPHSQDLNPALFTWSLSTVTFTGMLIFSAMLRLVAYRQLGTNFTFALAKPKQLITSGMYGYVQHPSYTTLFLVVVANTLMLLRTGGVLGCWLPGWIANSEWVNQYTHIVLIMQGAIGIMLRVKQEEEMLKRTWGKPWEEYHAKTKRFVPWVI